MTIVDLRDLDLDDWAAGGAPRADPSLLFR
jgi:hypothetical protein